jgi:hypothetical protein
VGNSLLSNRQIGEIQTTGKKSEFHYPAEATPVEIASN